MTEFVPELLIELEQFGLSNDGVITDRPRRMLNITRDTGEFLSVLVRAMNARRVLEIGTSNGYDDAESEMAPMRRKFTATRHSGLPWQLKQSKGMLPPLNCLILKLPLRQRTSSDLALPLSLRKLMVRPAPSSSAAPIKVSMLYFSIPSALNIWTGGLTSRESFVMVGFLP